MSDTQPQLPSRIAIATNGGQATTGDNSPITTKRRRYWYCGRRPWGFRSLATIAGSRREARRQYREWLHRQGAPQPRFVFVKRGERV